MTLYNLLALCDEKAVRVTRRFRAFGKSGKEYVLHEDVSEENLAQVYERKVAKIYPLSVRGRAFMAVELEIEDDGRGAEEIWKEIQGGNLW